MTHPAPSATAQNPTAQAPTAQALAAQAQQEARKLSRLALWVGLGVLLTKLLAAWLTASVGVLSDALESGVNVAAALMLMFVVRLSALPADPEHPYGHHKAEYLSSFVEGLLIGVAGLIIVQSALSRFAEPQPLEPHWWGLMLVALASLPNYLLGKRLMRRGRALHSPALHADGAHLLSDVYSSAAVLVGVALAMLLGWWWLDPVIGLLMAAVLLYMGVKVVLGSLSGLMDEALSAPEQAQIHAVLSSFSAEYIEYHDLRSRRAGPRMFTDFHLILPAHTPLSTAHDLTDRIEAALEAALPGINVTIHLEPEAFAKGELGLM